MAVKSKSVARLLLTILLVTLGVSCTQSPVATQGPPDRELRDVTPEHTGRRELYRGQLVYVPCYSHIRLADGRDFRLSITLSIRNTSLKETLEVSSVEYFDTEGVLKKNYGDSFTVQPLGTAEFFIKEDDMTGGSGANFLVSWQAEKAIPEPIIEAVMVGTGGSQGVSFTCAGRLLKERPDPALGE